jgi:hypothetical protein
LLQSDGSYQRAVADAGSAAPSGDAQGQLLEAYAAAARLPE